MKLALLILVGLWVNLLQIANSLSCDVPPIPDIPGVNITCDAECRKVKQEFVEKIKACAGSYGASINMNSGCRPPARNADAGGAQNSNHLTGSAVDLNPIGGGGDCENLKKACEKAIPGVRILDCNHGKTPHVHMDLGGGAPCQNCDKKEDYKRDPEAQEGEDKGPAGMPSPSSGVSGGGGGGSPPPPSGRSAEPPMERFLHRQNSAENILKEIHSPIGKQPESLSFQNQDPVLKGKGKNSSNISTFMDHDELKNQSGFGKGHGVQGLVRPSLATGSNGGSASTALPSNSTSASKDPLANSNSQPSNLPIGGGGGGGGSGANSFAPSTAASLGNATVSIAGSVVDADVKKMESEFGFASENSRMPATAEEVSPQESLDSLFTRCHAIHMKKLKSGNLEAAKSERSE